MSGLSVNSPKLGVDGIVLYLDSFNRKSYRGGTTWNDLTLNKRNTSLVNGPILGSDNGIVFDGSDDYLSIPYFDLSNQSFAIDLWYRPSQNATYLRGILSCGDTWSGSANPGWALGFGDSSNTISYGVRSSAGQIYRGSGPTLVPNIIYNLFMVRNAEENLLYLYVNGNLHSSLSLPSDVSLTGNRTSITHAIWAYSPIGPIGTFYSIKIYNNRSFTQAEINKNYHAVKNRYTNSPVNSGLILYLDAANTQSYQPGSTSWNDLTNNGNNATLVNGPTFSSNTSSILFDGVNDSATVTFNNRSDTVNTVEILFRWRSGTGGMFIGFNSYDIWTQNGALGFNTASSDIWGISSTRVSQLGLVGTSNSNWHHYVFVFSNQIQNNKIYIDGNSETLTQQIGTTNLTQNRTFTSSFKLSGWMNDSGYPINGDYALVRVYNRELSAQEIQQNFNASRDRFGI